MFEGYTSEIILESMLNNVSDDIDKREGSVIWDALAPVAAELAAVYESLDNILNECFVDTASLEYLKLKAAERGLTYTEASYAFVSAAITFAENSGELTEGETFFTSSGVIFKYSGMTSDDGQYYLLECTTAGTAGNVSGVSLVYDGTSASVTSAEIVEIVEYGSDAETADDLRARYYNDISAAAFGGNIADYTDKVLQIDGVKGVQVRRATSDQEPGTVTLVVMTESGYETEDVIADVQAYFDPLDEDGERLGTGMAPVGHLVTAQAVGEQTVSITAAIEFEDGYSADDIADNAAAALEEYFEGVCDDWASDGTGVLRTGKVVLALMAVSGVLDASEISFIVTDEDGNEETVTSNIEYSGDVIPVFGGFTVA